MRKETGVQGTGGTGRPGQGDRGTGRPLGDRGTGDQGHWETGGDKETGGQGDRDKGTGMKDVLGLPFPQGSLLGGTIRSYLIQHTIVLHPSSFILHPSSKSPLSPGPS
ncbi:MAG: hypothetical protein F6J93_24135 [Oscillatoria sp. SIO1A7]|nr:hypothetical protein [Oscillatoria sp. SIO1A7]